MAVLATVLTTVLTTAAVLPSNSSGSSTGNFVTNLALQSQTLDNGTWIPGQTTVTANATAAPDGTTTAEKIVETATTAVHQIAQVINVTSNKVYTWSVFAKAAQRSILIIDAFLTGISDNRTYFDLTNGIVLTNASGNIASITNYGNGWYRCSVTRNTGAATSIQTTFGCTTTDNSASYLGSSPNGIFLWGAQFESGSEANTYIPTTTVAVTQEV